ncbi:hypothetical protein [Arthrobacter sp. H41]|uniref:hypothetical protein n=1 Tax=Arthrobacter sp. H41 TaxID=1312978 RepID=UPI0004B2B631|nr:hypothetical protein [Arthrobacter sp. H41]
MTSVSGSRSISRLRPVRWHWAVQVLSIFALARAISLGILVWAAGAQGPSPWGGAAPGYGAFINYWDSGWYQQVFDNGYPEVLPRNADGVVVPNQWAFYPLFPGLVRLIDQITGIGWGAAAPFVAVASGFAAALVVYRLFRLRTRHRDALWGVGLVAVLPVSPILQIPYAESLHLLLLASSLYLVARRRYLTAVPVVLTMCFARPAGVPFAVLLAGMLVSELMREHGSGPGRLWDAARKPDTIRLAVLTASTGIGALAWPIAAWLSTGQFSAYVETETAWREDELSPFTPWLAVASSYFGPVLGAGAVAVLAVGCVLLLRTAAVRRLGTAMQFWCAAYLLYLAAFWNPQTSTFRILLPLFPLALSAVLISRNPRYRWALAAVSVLLQVVWVAWLWTWSPSTPEGDYPP